MKGILKGKVMRLEEMISQRTHQTISKGLSEDGRLRLFSMGAKTTISAEAYGEIRLYLLFRGDLSIGEQRLHPGEAIAMGQETYFGLSAEEDAVFLEILGGREMKNIEKGRVLDLRKLLDYEEGGIANLDINDRGETKIMMMAFDRGEGLSPHKAPADALLLALEGEAKVTVGEEEMTLSAGEQVVFPEGVLHNVEALTRFKMLLILPR